MSITLFEQHLATTPFLVDGTFSVADIIVGFAVAWARDLGWTCDFSHCVDYDRRLLAMPHCPYRGA